MARGQKRSSNQLVVPEAGQALDQLKYEIAAELGLPVGKNLSNFADAEFATELGSIPVNSVSESYWGHVSTRDAGAVGGNITKRLAQIAEQQLNNL
jgi:hypothetical protein